MAHAVPRMLDNRLQAVFSEKRFEPPLFYTWPVGLRFELGGEWGKAPHSFCTQRFYQAMHRAKMLLEYVFQDSKILIVKLVFHTEQKTKTPTRELERCGFTLPADHEKNHKLGENGHIYNISFSDGITSTNAHAILWAIMSNEIGIKPTAALTAYYIDLDKGIVAHPYDDRGMDLVANSKLALADCYAKFNGWILDYDRARIDEVFKSVARSTS